MAEAPFYLRAYEGRAPFARRRLGLLLTIGLFLLPVVPGISHDADAVSASPSLVCSGSTCTWTFPYTGDYYEWTVPSGVSQVGFDVYGAQGGNGGPSAGASGSPSSGGLGGRVQGKLALTPGQVLRIYVGGQGTSQSLNGAGGFNGGGSTNATSDDNRRPGAGGGASDIRTSSTLASRLVVAGGGGGASGWMTSGGGAGGGLVGGGGPSPYYCSTGAGGGTQSAGGGVGGCGGNVGALGTGGNGKGNSHGGGGGGGGYYGGGGATIDSGAGGSSYADATLATEVVHTQGSRSGNGLVVLTMLKPAVSSFAATVSTPSNQSSSLTYNLQFSESVTGLLQSEIILSGTSTGWSISSFSGSGSTYTVGLTGSNVTSGSVVLTVAQDAVTSSVTSQTGPGSATASSTLTIDVDRPTASVSSTPSSPAAAMSLTFGMTFGESVSGIASGDFSNAGTALGCVFTPSAASGTSINVVVTQCQEGTLQLRLAADGVTDAAGNTGPASAVTSSSVTLAASALSVTAADKSVNYGGSWTDSYSQTGLLAGDSITVTYSYSGTTTLGTAYGPSATKPTSGGTYSIIPSVSYGAGNTNRYSLTKNNGTLTIARVAQSALTVTSTSATYGADYTLTSSGGSGSGAVTYAVTNGTCTVSGSTLTPGDAGSVCKVTATKAADDNYNAVTSAETTVTVNRSSQSALSVTSLNATYGETLGLTATGGSGNGAVSWAVVSGTCTVSGSTLTPGNAGSSCVVRATKAQDTNYNAVVSADTAITIARAQQAALTVTSTSATYGQSYSLTTSGGSGGGSVTWSVISGTCTVSGSTLTPGNAGSSCVVRATKAQDTNYLVVNSADTTVTIARAAQATLTVSTTSATYGATLWLSTSGGSGTGAVTWTVVSGDCTVSGSALTPGDAGSPCVVRATKAQDTNYLVKNSADTSVSTARASQDNLTVTSVNATYSETLALTVSGGSGNGAVTWTVVSGTCTVSGSSLTPGNAGSSCVVRATKAQDTNYLVVSSPNTTITVGKGTQSGLAVTSADSMTTGTPHVLTASGGQSTGALSWSVTSGICTMSGSSLSAARGGVTCTVEVTRAGDSNWLAASETQTVTVNKITQSLVFRSVPPSPANPGGTYTVSVESDAFLAPTVVIANQSASVCSISSGVVTFNSLGTCLVSASQSGNDVYSSAAASQSVTVVAVNAPAPTTTAPVVGPTTATVPVGPTTTVPRTVTSAVAATTTTAPRATTTTVALSTNDPGAPNAGADGRMPELGAGETTAIVRGQAVKAKVASKDGQMTVSLPNDVVIRIGSTDASSPSAKVSSDGVLRAFPQAQIEVSAQGFVPDTTFTVFMFSEPVELGRGTTDASGSMTQLVTLPKDSKSGDHTFQINGVGAGSEVVSVSLGFEVVEKDDNTLAAVIAITVAILLALLGGRPVIRRRRTARP